MELIDKDLQSIQEVRKLLEEAEKAEKILATFEQEKLNAITKAMKDACLKNAVKLAKMANEETGFGIWQDKVVKNVFGSLGIYEAIKDQKTVGFLKEDREKKVWEIGVPVGVIAGIVPSTNPTSTIMYKSLIAIKSGNSIVFSPHPGAKKAIMETIRIVSEAAESAGCPRGAISGISIPTLEATQELMKSPKTKLILATGGYAMVKSAYSSGTPAIGVGAGNGPAFIEKTANVKQAVKRILDSKTFDNGTICASEQSIIVEKCMEEKVVNELKAQGAYFLQEEESKKLESFILRPNGTMNPQIVGHSVQQIAKLSGLNQVPDSARVLVARETRVGDQYPYSREKLAPIIAFYVEENAEQVLEKVTTILHLEGVGHSFCMHSEDESVIRYFALRVPASRIIINGMGALGGVGASTNLFPALTLGCGNVGGSSSSNNIGPLDLINIKRVAYGVKELEQLKSESLGHSEVSYDQNNYNYVNQHSGTDTGNQVLVDEIVKRIMKELI